MQTTWVCRAAHARLSTPTYLRDVPRRRARRRAAPGTALLCVPTAMSGPGRAKDLLGRASADRELSVHSLQQPQFLGRTVAASHTVRPVGLNTGLSSSGTASRDSRFSWRQGEESHAVGARVQSPATAAVSERPQDARQAKDPPSSTAFLCRRSLGSERICPQARSIKWERRFPFSTWLLPVGCQ